jgi:hypothetical protein
MKQYPPQSSHAELHGRAAEIIKGVRRGLTFVKDGLCPRVNFQA